MRLPPRPTRKPTAHGKPPMARRVWHQQGLDANVQLARTVDAMNKYQVLKSETVSCLR